VSKKLSEDQKKNIVENFVNGMSIEELVNKYKYTKLTITRHLKNNLDEKIFSEHFKKNKIRFERNTKNNVREDNEVELQKISYRDSQISDEAFFEIPPLNFEIDNETQKDLSSVPISEIDFPNLVYMIVNSQIELETKFLKDYPNWQFLAKSELSRKTIEVFFDIKIAKSFCSKEQKVIKVPNTNIFRLAASHLLAKGISRIVTPDKLVAL